MSDRRNSNAVPIIAPRRAQQDLLALGIAVAATIMVTGIAGSALTQVWYKALGIGFGPNQMLTNALLLNIALVIFGWRRYDDLHAEVVARRAQEAHAKLMVQTDPLTGCLNRHSITPATDQLIADSRERGEIVAFVMIDINNFKQINELNGHAVGDAILTELAGRLSGIMPAGALVARLGGDEFVCAIPFEPAQAERIDHLAEAIIAVISEPMEANVFDGEISAAIGIAHCDRSNRMGTGPADAGSLLHMADIAMYQAKKHGRNHVLWFEDAMEIELRYRSELESGVRVGIARGEFVPYYEQQVDLTTGEILGFEMLARWHSPAFGVVGPDVFIPIAEEIGLIADMSECLIAQALCDAQEWDPRLTLSVNISPVQLRDPWFAQKVLKLLVAANFPPHRLDIEITETSLHQNIAGVHSLITSLRNQGISISLDDFGTGYSSLAQLRRLPFDRIKIDRSFVTAMNNDPDSRTIVETIAALGKGLGLPVTAEGVENAELLENLRELGQFKGQGYLYGRPQPADATRRLLAERHLLAEGVSDDGLDSQAPDETRRLIA
jgi:diguanylate cyclase (GGDEF)-like protein